MNLQLFSLCNVLRKTVKIGVKIEVISTVCLLTARRATVHSMLVDAQAAEDTGI